jgi:LysR family transcriptional regulator, nod-box dependent transcriptional activator
VLLRRHNLNLVPILRELLRTCSVSRTAEAVGLSQSSVSAALARLRAIFDDDLLVPDGRNLVLTARGAELIEPAERAVAELEALLQPRRFDPAHQARQFVIATADYVSMLLAAPITAKLAELAPRSSVAFIDVPATLVSELQQGAIDFAILPEGYGLERHDRLARLRLFSDENVVIASRTLRPFTGPLTIEAYRAAQHAAFQMSRRVDPILAEAALPPPPQAPQSLVMVQQFSSLPAIVESTACLAVVQRRLAQRLRQLYAIDLFPLPFEHDPLHISAYYSNTSAYDPGHRWFLDLLASIAPDDDPGQ